jgi:HEAT repeat protein
MTAPIYAGKTLDEWATALTDGSSDAKPQAASALAAIGATGETRAVDALSDELSKPLPPIDATALQFTTVDLLGEATEIDRDAAVRVAVVTAIGTCGELASRSVSRLCELLGQERTWAKPGPMRAMIAVAMGDAAVTDAVSAVLAAIGEPAISCVRALLQSRSANVRGAAARVLGLMGPVARAAIPDLELLAFRDPYEATRTDAQRSLERLR